MLLFFTNKEGLPVPVASRNALMRPTSILLPKVLLSNIKPSTAVVYAIMSADWGLCMTQKGRYAPTIESLALDTNQSISSIKRAIKVLVNLGVIENVGTYKGRNCWRLNPVNDLLTIKG